MKSERLLTSLNIVVAEVRAARMYALLQCAILVVLVFIIFSAFLYFKIGN